MIAEYNRDGFVIARGLLKPDDVNAVLADMHLLALQQLKHIGGWPHAHGLHEDLAALLVFGQLQYLATLTLCAKLQSLWELYLDDGISRITDDLGIKFPVFQTQPVVHVMSDRLKIDGGYFGFGAHQDWPTLQGSLDTITVWIPFTEVGPENFTMEVAPGSHKAGLYPYTRKANIFEVDGTITNWTPIVAKPGDVVFMSAFTVHRSSTQGSGLRIASSFRYENAAEPTFIKRGYPFAHKRVVTEELITPDFPSAEAVRMAFE